MKVENATEIVPNLWVGNMHSAQDPSFIINNRINVIINSTKDLPFIDVNVNYKMYKYRVLVHDNLKKEEIERMIPILHKIVPILKQHHDKGDRILVHCHAGMQRSAIIVLAYLFLYVIYDFQRAIRFMQKRRPIVFTPGMNFKPSIIAYLNKVLAK